MENRGLYMGRTRHIGRKHCPEHSTSLQTVRKKALSSVWRAAVILILLPPLLVMFQDVRYPIPNAIVAQEFYGMGTG